MEEKNFRSSGGILEYPNMQVKRFYLSYDPPQIGILYKPHPNESKKKIFLIKLNGLILVGDSVKITQTLFNTYPTFLNKELVNSTQIIRLVEMYFKII